MLDPRRLLTFREVARQGSFSRAGEALALSQPAVSQQVGALERELGTALLVRGRSGTVPTPAGELLLAHADALAARLELADTQMDALVEGERGVQAGRLHAAVCFQDASAPRREHEGMRRADLAEDPMVAVLPADHRLAG